MSRYSSHGSPSRTAARSSRPSDSSPGIWPRPAAGDRVDWPMVWVWSGAVALGLGFWAAVGLVLTTIVGGAW